MRKYGVVCATICQQVSILVLLIIATPALAQQGATVRCGNLLKLTIAETTIESAEVVPAGRFVPSVEDGAINHLPEFCRVVGVTKPAIRFEVWMPVEKWNGRFEVVGNGGMAGFISYGAMANALRRGDATASTDTGHVNHPHGDGFDSSWALGHPELVADLGYRGLHLTTVNGKQIVSAFYGKAAEHAYYVGCSRGGGQGLMEAQRFPADFDGILAGDPANNSTGLYAGSHLWYSMAMLKDPESYLQPAKVKLLADAVNKACDAKDGFADGVLDDPRACRFDPAELTCKEGEGPAGCLTAKQVAAVKKIWSGVKDASGKQVFPGLVPGGEWGSGGWASWVTGSAPYMATHWKAAEGFFKYVVFDDANYDPMTFNFGSDLEKTRAKVGAALDAVDPDLRPMQRRGAKLILYHGWSDPDISPLNTIDYYKQVEAVIGPTTPEFARLFMVPGMQHCGGGPGATSFDAVPALERWVEEGVAPEKIVASHSTQGVVDRTRPLCPYPKVAVYDGNGKESDAASFACKMPGAERAGN